MKKGYFLIYIVYCLGIGASNAQYTLLHSFNGYGGSFPVADLTNSGNKFYGMTTQGGVNNYGCIFSIDTNGSGYKDMFDFNNSNGSYPKGSLILSGNKLCGVCSGGGRNGDGVAFSIDTNGYGYKDLFDFNASIGSTPQGSLILYGNKLYGMTTSGGVYNNGVVFKIDTNGIGYKDLFDFDSTNGKLPQGSLTHLNNKLYGMTLQGGANGNGVIFSIDTNGNGYKDMFDFNGIDGANPCGSLILLQNKLYGMTLKGGIYGSGVVFLIDTNGTRYKILHGFNVTNGSNPYGSLIFSNGLLYGMTSVGGNGCASCGVLGVIFSIDTNGARYNDLLTFNSANGENPEGSLVILGNSLYGMTQNGGVNDAGVVFSYNTARRTIVDSIVRIKNINCFGDSSGSVCVIATRGTPPYRYVWSPGGATRDTVSGLKVGTYTVVVSDTYNNTTTDSVVITQSSQLKINTYSNLSNCKTNNGSASTIVSGGLSPYAYKWYPVGGTGSTANGLSAGYYTCIVTDSLGCNKNAIVNIKDSGTLSTSIISYSRQLKCFGDSYGNAIASVSGGTKPYTYLWSPSGGSDTVAQNLNGGTYTFSCTDSKGCTSDTIIHIYQPGKIKTITYGHCGTYAAGPGGPYYSLGSAKAKVSGGVPPYSYQWNPSCSTNDTIGPSFCTLGCGGLFCCTITDANGCVDSSCGYFGYDAIEPIAATSKEIKVYPSPSKGLFTIQSNSILLNSAVEIYNMFGEKIYSSKLHPTTTQIDLSTNADGIYLYRVLTENGDLISSGKMVIQK